MLILDMILAAILVVRCKKIEKIFLKIIEKI